MTRAEFRVFYALFILLAAFCAFPVCAVGFQAFEGGAAWKADTRRILGGTWEGESQRTLPPTAQPKALVGAATDRHLQTLANSAAALCGIPPDLFWRLIMRESSGRHYDKQGNVLRSSSNALGAAQIKLGTIRGLDPTLDPMDPWQNVLGGACVLRAHYDRRGSWSEALHDYRTGPNAARSSVGRAYALAVMEGGQ
jgi:hypothetical protein